MQARRTTSTAATRAPPERPRTPDPTPDEHRWTRTARPRTVVTTPTIHPFAEQRAGVSRRAGEAWGWPLRGARVNHGRRTEPWGPARQLSGRLDTDRWHRSAAAVAPAVSATTLTTPRRRSPLRDRPGGSKHANPVAETAPSVHPLSARPGRLRDGVHHSATAFTTPRPPGRQQTREPCRREAPCTQHPSPGTGGRAGTSGRAETRWATGRAGPERPRGPVPQRRPALSAFGRRYRSGSASPRSTDSIDQRLDSAGRPTRVDQRRRRACD